MDDAANLAIRKLHDELIAAQRHALLGSVALHIAHEINNLMTPVLARAQDAVDRDDVAAMRKALTVTAKQTQTAIAIMRRLLDLGRGEAPAATSCEVRGAILAAVTAAVRPFEKDGIELTIDAPDGLTVHADPVLLSQVLLNLLVHARENIGERSGKVAVRAMADPNVAPDRNTILIDVRDSGTRTSPDNIRSLLAPFLESSARESPVTPAGVDPGLAVCRLIVQFHGGRISAEPVEGAGCMIRLSLPAHRLSEPEASARNSRV